MASTDLEGFETRDIHVDDVVRVADGIDVPSTGYAIRGSVLYERAEPLGPIGQVSDPGRPSDRYGLSLGTSEQVRVPEIIRISFRPYR